MPPNRAGLGHVEFLAASTYFWGQYRRRAFIPLRLVLVAATKAASPQTTPYLERSPQGGGSGWCAPSFGKYSRTSHGGGRSSSPAPMPSHLFPVIVIRYLLPLRNLWSGSRHMDACYMKVMIVVDTRLHKLKTRCNGAIWLLRHVPPQTSCRQGCSSLAPILNWP